MKWLTGIGANIKLYAWLAATAIAVLFAGWFKITRARLKQVTKERDIAKHNAEVEKQARDLDNDINRVAALARERAAQIERENKKTTEKPTGNFGDNRLK